jgi:hypothetical protein
MRAAVGLAVMAIVTSCSQLTGLSSTELAPVVRRDAVPFTAQTIPEEVLDRLSQYRVVVVGETHFLREHRELMAELVHLLHARGFRQLLMELPQMADWLLADYVLDGGLVPDWELPLSLGGDLLAAVRDFNRTLPEEERVQVHGIDMNLQDYGGAQSFQSLLGALAEHLSNPGPIPAFLASDYDSAERQEATLEALDGELRARRRELTASWGEHWYDTVAEMIEVESASIVIRALRDVRYSQSARLREDVMKRLADLWIEGYPHGTLINVGGNHAQKNNLKGTEQEWLGDYLVHRSEAAGGSVIVLVETAARIIPDSNSEIAGYDLSASPDNELFRLMHEEWPDQIVFLPVDDPIFLDEVLMNFEGTIYSGAPKKTYDVFLLLPLAHRVPLD